MDVRRGKLPEQVSRAIEIDISREEMLVILSSYLKAKLKSGDLRIDTVKGVTTDNVADSQGVIVRLEGMTLSGEEMITVPWPSPSNSPSAINPPNPASNPFAMTNVDKKPTQAKPAEASV